MIGSRTHHSQHRVAEYELDADDLLWLATFNRGARQPLIDEDRMEKLMDILEKVSFDSLHEAQSQRLSLPSCGQASYPKPTISLGAVMHAPRRRDTKRSASRLPSPSRLYKSHKSHKFHR